MGYYIVYLNETVRGKKLKIGILVAMEEEKKRLMEVISDEVVHEMANQTFFDGFIYGQPVTIVQAGIGKVNATIATTLLIHTFEVDAVINTGSAGGIGEGLTIGDLVIATELAHHDADNRAFGYTYGQIPQMPATFLTDESLSERIEKTAQPLEWQTKRGLIVTGDSFVAGTDQIAKIKEFFPNALVTEMEGVAVAQTCHQFDVPCAVIRAVSDTADEEASVNFDEFVVLAGQRSAELVLSLIADRKE